MKVYDEKHIKNIVLLGSAKSGKTTLAETMLFEAGLLDRRGTVEDKNTVSDYHEIEHERGNSVFATPLHTEWRNYKINIIDTPGLMDFAGEVVSSLRVADTCVVLINAQMGVEVSTNLIWRHVDRFQKPVIFAMNQLDHPKADFEEALESMKDTFGDAVTLMQYPYGEGEGFNCIIDLLKMIMYKFPEGGGKPEKVPIPDEEKERANELHNELVEKAAENDEALMELYFEKGTLTEDEMREGLKLGMRNQDVMPVFCISAKENMGSGRMMGFIDNVAPAAIDTTPEETADGNEIPLDPSAPTTLFVFKTSLEPSVGKFSFFKVLSGEVKAGDTLFNSQTETNEQINQLFIMDGKKRNPIDKLVTGDIGATIKLKSTETSHTLRDKDHEITVRPIDFPNPKIRIAVEAVSKQDEEKVSEVLKKLRQEDPTIILEQSHELRQLILSCQGELQLSIIKWRMQHLYKVECTFKTPRIPYRETIHKSAEASYRHKKQSGGAGQFGEVFIFLEPYEEGKQPPSQYNVRKTEEIDLDWGGKLIFYNCIVGGVIDARFIPSVLKGIMEKMEFGPLTGSYVRDVRVSIYDGKMHPVDSNDISFKIAGQHAFKEAFRNASPQLLEPVHDLTVYVPEELMGDVMTDLQSRRAIIMGMEVEANNQVIKAKVPLAELDRYSTALRSITQGRAVFTSEFAEYAPVPYEVQKRLIEEHSMVEA